MASDGPAGLSHAQRAWSWPAEIGPCAAVLQPCLGDITFRVADMWPCGGDIGFCARGMSSCRIEKPFGANDIKAWAIQQWPCVVAMGDASV